MGKRARRFSRANGTRDVDVVALDDFFRLQGLESIYHVAIDVEGFDALVLEGMQQTIRQRRVALIEFEVNELGYWSRGSRHERRRLRTTIAWLESSGYQCFWQLPNALVPTTTACFIAGSDRAPLKWSNIVCAHEAPTIAVLDNMSYSAYEERTRSLRPAHRLALEGHRRVAVAAR